MDTDQTVSEKKINWTELTIFYVVAVLVSAPFRLGFIQLDEMFPLPYGLNIFYRILRGIGPGIGFLVVYYLLKSKVDRKLTFWGLNKWYSILAVVIIPVSLAIAGVSNTDNLDQHYFGLITGILLVLYALGEEYGWRGYLQQALEPMKYPYRILTIAVLWYLWHLVFLLPDVTVKTHLLFFGFLLLGSWGLLKVSESTFSILFVAAVHLAFNLLSEVRLEGWKKLFVIAVVIAVWTILIVSLNKNKRKAGV